MITSFPSFAKEQKLTKKERTYHALRGIYYSGLATLIEVSRLAVWENSGDLMPLDLSLYQGEPGMVKTIKKKLQLWPKYISLLAGSLACTNCIANLMNFFSQACSGEKIKTIRQSAD